MSPIKNVEHLVKEAVAVSVDEFLSLAETVMELLADEQNHAANRQVLGRLVNLKPEGEAIVVGDVHGDLESLSHILNATDFIEKAKSSKPCLLVFLGDYGDRGIRSPEVYYIVLKLKETFPKKVFLLRGNHEGPDDLLAHPHDLPDHLHTKFGADSSRAYAKLRELSGHLHSAVIVKGKYVLLHGGVPTQAKTVDDLAYAHQTHPSEPHLEEILWSDPWEGLSGICASPRGAGKLFGENETSRFLNLLNVKVLIRGHEPSPKGFKFNHSGKIITLFSRKGAPYSNEQGAYLQLDLGDAVKKAFQLEQLIRFF